MNNILHKIFGTTPGKGVQPKEAIAYSVAGFGENFICTIIGSYLTIFMTDALLFGSDSFTINGVSGTMAVAFLMLAVRVFDACNDPIMGSIVDKTRTKWGKCRPYLKWTVIPIAIVTLLCFLPAYQAESATSFFLIAAVYTVWSVVYTVADVPYWGLSSCLTNNTEVRGNILTVARLACTLGAGIVTVLVPIITSAVTAKYKDEALDFGLFLTNKENQLALAKRTNIISTNKEALSDSFYNSSENLMAKARSISAKQISHIQPVMRQSNNQKDINTLVNTAVQSILLNKDSTQNILNKLAKDWQNLF